MWRRHGATDTSLWWWRRCAMRDMRSMTFAIHHRGGHGFKWSEIDPDFQNWTPQQCQKGLTHPLAIKQLDNDIEAMDYCDICILVLPCGRSAHMEAGWFAGKGKKVIALLPDPQEPELMYGMFDAVVCSIEDVLNKLSEC